MTQNEIFFAINGEKAVELAYKFQGNACYRGIYNHGKRLAQLEVTVDEPGEYNGYPQKWVDVMTSSENANETLRQLAKIGFTGYALVSYETETNGHLETVECGWIKI